VQGLANAMRMRKREGEGEDDGGERRKRRGEHRSQPREHSDTTRAAAAGSVLKSKTLPRAPHLVPHTQRPCHALHRRHTFVGKRLGTWAIPGIWQQQQRRKRQARCSGAAVSSACQGMGLRRHEEAAHAEQLIIQIHSPSRKHSLKTPQT
jgi:hypothetical protein